MFAIYVACRDYLSVFNGKTAIMAIYIGWYVSQNPEMGVSFDAEFRTMLAETFGSTPDKAWAEAKTMIAVVVEDPEFRPRS